MFPNNFIFLLCLFYVSIINGLRWTRSGLTEKTETIIATRTTQSGPEIDVSHGVQVIIIKNSVTFERSITIFCFVSGVNYNSKIEFLFCKAPDSCKVAQDGEVDTVFNFKVIFNTTFSGKTGMRVELKLGSEELDYTGSYFCKAKNDKFEIISNNIDIRDVSYWVKNLFQGVVIEYKTDIKNISINALPQVLKCVDNEKFRNPLAPLWTKMEFFSPTLWTVCPVLDGNSGREEGKKQSFEKCKSYSHEKCGSDIDRTICPSPIESMSHWNTFSNDNGDLIFTNLSPGSTFTGSYLFMCYHKDSLGRVKPISYFHSSEKNTVLDKGIILDAVKREDYRRLELISPPLQDVTLYARHMPVDDKSFKLQPNTISVIYKSMHNVKYEWKFGQRKLEGNTRIGVSKYTLTFNDEISVEDAGKYTLEVTQDTAKISADIDVTVRGYPVLAMDSCMPPLNYVWEGDSLSIECEYKQRPTQINLQINTQEIKLSDSLDNSKANLKKEYPYLELLNFTVSPRELTMQDNLKVSYHVYNMTKTIGQSLYQDHTITFVAKNEIGSIVKSSSIYVVPHLETLVTNFPENSNCTMNCDSTVSHTFKCEVNVDQYLNKELKIDYFWSVSSNRLGPLTDGSTNEYTPYFSVDPKTKELTMLPIRTNNTELDHKMKGYLKNNDIECNVDLIVITPGETKGTYLYQSTLDRKLRGRMKARITLDYVPLNNAYIYWIMALVLCLLVLIILVILVTRHCLKNKGESYPLDKLERKHGYNPEKEVQDEMFKPYEREEHDFEAGRGLDEGRRMSLTGNSVGSNDDGELDRYDIDPSNFNEDGSIIGKYGANPRNRAAMT